MNGIGTGDAAANGFPTRAPVELEDRPRRQQWLIDGLWMRQAVGIVGGEPKCGKSFLALDLAVAIAAGTRFESLDIAVIDVPTLRLDHRADRQRLVETVERTRASRLCASARAIAPWRVSRPSSTGWLAASRARSVSTLNAVSSGVSGLG